MRPQTTGTYSLSQSGCVRADLQYRRAAPVPTPRPHAKGKAKPKPKPTPKRHLMTAPTTSSPPTLASVYIGELRANYPQLPWGPLCTGTDKQMTLCYALQVIAILIPYNCLQLILFPPLMLLSTKTPLER